MTSVTPMSEADRLHWNERYVSREIPAHHNPYLDAVADFLPTAGDALDLAGGSGRNAIWLAHRGLDVAVLDVSDVGLGVARERATEVGVAVETMVHDLDDGLPAGTWDLISMFHYLNRPLFAAITDALRPGGVLVGVIATVRNLERNERPPLPYLLREGELPQLLSALELLHYEEAWNDEDRHEARFVARRPSETPVHPSIL